MRLLIAVCRVVNLGCMAAHGGWYVGLALAQLVLLALLELLTTQGLGRGFLLALRHHMPLSTAWVSINGVSFRQRGASTPTCGEGVAFKGA